MIDEYKDNCWCIWSERLVWNEPFTWNVWLLLKAQVIYVLKEQYIFWMPWTAIEIQETFMKVIRWAANCDCEGRVLISLKWFQLLEVNATCFALVFLVDYGEHKTLGWYRPIKMTFKCQRLKQLGGQSKNGKLKENQEDKGQRWTLQTEQNFKVKGV